MAVSNLLAQARAGQADAIAQLMNQQFQSHGVKIQASRENRCLRLRLEGETLLTQSGFVAYVEQAMGRLGCPMIERVEIAAMEWGRTHPLWQSSVQVMGTDFERPGLEGVDDRFEDDIAAIASAAPSKAQQNLAAPSPYVSSNSASSQVSPPPAVKRLPMPNRKTIAMQWFTASLLGTIATLMITATLSAMLIPLVASMTGMEQLSGFALAILLAMQLIIGIPIAGLVIGYSQMRMLRRYFKTVGGWLLITPLGCLMGFFIAVIIHFVGHSALGLAGWANSLGQPEGLTGQLLSLACTTLGFGFGFGFLGLAQFAILTGRMHRAQRWIGMMGGSGMVAWLVAGGLFKLMLPALDQLARWANMTPMLLGTILAAIAAWLVFHSLSSLAMAVLLRPQGGGTKLAQGSPSVV